MNTPAGKEKVKYIVVTGGVVSGIGKGVAAASIGQLLKDRINIIAIKCDGYLNADPGTMNPVEHGEVFVLDDGGEVDMDFGHYERFLDINAKSQWNITMGKVYKQILENERKGVYLGKTVQLIPHVSDEIKRRIYGIADDADAELVLLEIGGTVGDMENELFIESVRQIMHEVGRENIMFLHLTYVPIPSGTNEQKSKPTQQSVKVLNQSGIYPDLIVARCEEMISDSVKEKIAMYCNIPKEAVVSGIDVDPIYELPLLFERQSVSELIHKRLNIYSPPNLGETERLVNVIKKNQSTPKITKTIALCGKYTDLEDSYASISEALTHASAHLDLKVEQKLIETTDLGDLGNLDVKQLLDGVDGVIIPGGFGVRGIEGKIKVIRYLRENDVPFLGICLGMQLAVIEYARNVCGINNANTREIEKDGHTVETAVIDLLPEQRKIENLGGSMRLGGHDVEIKEGTIAERIYQSNKVRKRFRHRYEVNPDFIKELEEGGIVFSGKAPGENIMQLMELPSHKFFMGGQFHPELGSRLEKPSVLFYHFLKATISQ